MKQSIIQEVREFRKYVGLSDKKRDEGLKTPKEIKRFDNLDYGVDKDHLLDVYRPKKVKGKLPVIISVHGGRWQYGDKELYQFYCMDLALRGFAVVNFTYRLAPENRFPKQLVDVKKAFDFVKKHSDEYDFDINNIFAVGDSAGAHLLSLYACLCDNKEYQEKVGMVKDNFIKPKAVGLNCGIYEMDENHVSNMRGILKKGRLKEDLPLMETFNWISDKFPPTFILSSDLDFLVNQQPNLKAKLDELKIENEMEIFKSTKEESLYHVFHVNMKLKTAKEANDEETDFFKKHIK